MNHDSYLYIIQKKTTKSVSYDGRKPYSNKALSIFSFFQEYLLENLLHQTKVDKTRLFRDYISLSRCLQFLICVERIRQSLSDIFQVFRNLRENSDEYTLSIRDGRDKGRLRRRVPRRSRTIFSTSLF